MSDGARTLAVQTREKECKKEGRCGCQTASYSQFVLYECSAPPANKEVSRISSHAKYSLNTVEITAYILFTTYSANESTYWQRMELFTGTLLWFFFIF